MAFSVQVVKVTGSATTSLTTASITTVAGSTLIGTTCDFAAGGATPVSDNKSNSYGAAFASVNDSAAVLRAYKKENAAGGSGHTMTFTFGANADPTCFFIAVDGAAAASYDSGSLVTGRDTVSPYGAASGTLAQANSLVISLISADTATPPPLTYVEAAFTITQESNSALYWTQAVGYQVVSSTSPVTPAWTVNGSPTGAAVMTFALKEAATDTTAPVLSSPTGSATSYSTATVGATTDEANGTMYAVVTTSATQPSVAQIKAGQDHTGSAAAFAGSQTVSSTGAKTFSATGLTASTVYYAHMVHTDAAANDSNRVTSASFTTSATPQILRPASVIAAGSWSPSTGASLTAVVDETTADDGDFAYTDTAADVLNIAVDAGSDPASSSGHIVRYRIRGDGVSGITVALMQSATVIASWTHDPAPTSFTTFEQTLSGGEADSITDYTALRLRFTEV